jgi:hypothetical protein
MVFQIRAKRRKNLRHFAWIRHMQRMEVRGKHANNCVAAPWNRYASSNNARVAAIFAQPQSIAEDQLVVRVWPVVFACKRCPRYTLMPRVSK